MDGIKLAFEDDAGILEAYGRASAWVNLAEYMLENLIFFKGGLDKGDPKVVRKLLDRKTLGQKLPVAIDLIDARLYKKISDLNKHRIMLAHGVVGEKRSGDLVEKIMFLGEKEIKLTKDFLSNIEKQAKEVIVDLHASFASAGIKLVEDK